MLTSDVASTEVEIQGLDFYLTRAIDLTVISDNKGYVAVYGKFLRFIFWSVLESNEPVSSPDSYIHNPGGKLSFPQDILDPNLLDFLSRRPKVIADLPQPSPHQQDKIFQQISREGKKFTESDAFRAISNEINNFNKKKT